MKLLSTALVLAALSAPALADSRSWTAAKGVLPDHVNVVAGANLQALRATSIYSSIVPQLLAKDRDAAMMFDLAKSTCAIDLHSAIVDVTFAIGNDDRGVVVAALDKSLDQKRVIECATKLVVTRTPPPVVEAAPPATGGGLRAGAKKPTVAGKPAPAPAAPKLVAKTTGKITEYGLDNDPKRIYVAWLAPDVVAFGTDADDKALLEKMIGGKGARGTITTYLGKASPNAAVWVASTKAQAIQQGVNMKGAFGTIDASKGNVSVDMSVVLADAKEAKGLVEQGKALIASMKGSVPPQFAKLIEALKLSAAADAANVKLTASEKDVMTALSVALMNL